MYLEESFLDKSFVNYFLNGRLVYRQWVKVKQGQLFPAVGVNKGPAKFKVTWPGMDGTPSINLISVLFTYYMYGILPNLHRFSQRLYIVPIIFVCFFYYINAARH